MQQKGNISHTVLISKSPSSECKSNVYSICKWGGEMENFEINCLQPPNKLFAAAKRK